jgi:hypothetical protein
MDGRCGKDADRWGIPPVLKHFDIRPMRDLDNKWRAVAEPRYGYGQPFWFSDERYPTPGEAMRAAELYSARGPSF